MTTTHLPTLTDHHLQTRLQRQYDAASAVHIVGVLPDDWACLFVVRAEERYGLSPIDLNRVPDGTMTRVEFRGDEATFRRVKEFWFGFVAAMEF